MDAPRTLFGDDTRLLIEWKRAYERADSPSILSSEGKLSLAVAIFSRAVSLCHDLGYEVAELRADDILGSDRASGLLRVEFVVGDAAGLHANGSGEYVVPIYEDARSATIAATSDAALAVPIHETVTRKLDSPF